MLLFIFYLGNNTLDTESRCLDFANANIVSAFLTSWIKSLYCTVFLSTEYLNFRVRVIWLTLSSGSFSWKINKGVIANAYLKSIGILHFLIELKIVNIILL